MRTIKWDEFLRQGEVTHHAVLHQIVPGGIQSMHGHRFTELFWGLKGECIHTINGQVQSFAENELILLRGDDVHELQCPEDKEFIYYLVSFPNELFLRLSERYSFEQNNLWGDDKQQPLKLSLSPMLREWLNAAVQDLIGNPDDTLAIDRFLTNLIFELRRMESEPYYSCPHWLQETLKKATAPEHFVRGPRVYADISGRSYEHVSRVLKAHTGLKPSEIFNRNRIEYAAGQLVVTDTALLEIAQDCGFASLGQFYSLFKQRYGLTPRKYRLRHRCIIPA